MNSKKRRRLIEEITSRDGDLCFYCECKTTTTEPEKISFATIDHVVVQADGGNDRPNNLVLACRRCNSHRGSSLFKPFCESVGVPSDRVKTVLDRINMPKDSGSFMIAPSEGIRTIYEVGGVQFDDLEEAEKKLKEIKRAQLRAMIVDLLPVEMDGRVKAGIARRLMSRPDKIIEIMTACQKI